MKILVACEFSGVVRRSFAALGHDAWSCDILPSEDNSPNHIEGNVLHILHLKWDMMIAHPPCTYLCNSGVRWLYNKDGSRNMKRWSDMIAATKFILRLWTAPIPRIAIENPIMHKYGTEGIGMRQSQIIQPWQFGHGETKATCLWLKNLPLLQPTKIVTGRIPRVHHASPGKNRWKERSRTLSGIGSAMALQWS